VQPAWFGKRKQWRAAVLNGSTTASDSAFFMTPLFFDGQTIVHVIT
jgi:hypothetical protein